MTKRHELSGKEFGRLIAVAFSESKGGRAYWSCTCSCGNSTVVAAQHLLRGRIRSCGCLKHDELIVRSTKHGMAGSPTYHTWANMIQRCSNPKSKDFKDYGARGISVCDKWLSFDSFLDDMGERPAGTSIDRMNNDGNYEPGNCRWATVEVQSKNKRTTRMIVFEGRAQTLSEWAKELGMRSSALHYRLKKYPVNVAMESQK